MKTEVLPEESELARLAPPVTRVPKPSQDREDWEDQTGPLAPRSGEEAAKFLREQSTDPIKNWARMCLQLQRMARGIPAAAPSALSAAIMTPKSERVLKISDLRRGMVGYCDDPNDSNPFGHIFFVAGRSKNGTILTWTNDAKGAGSVSVVPLSFYSTNWGDSFQFGATWLNGYDFSDFNRPPIPVEKDYEVLGDRYKRVIEDLTKIKNKKKGPLKTALERDINRMQKRLERYEQNS